ncbi:alpha-N-arabinofuranosidase 2 [Coniella lustricola]|uniref:Alpha-N-arabinofuranosidase 2 n=1 Tax=Coniella lustricola TaxID=2025994 RepID=A0A2T3AAI4_9PEZI|nr:alpha-N-arabinofuranosidase 2 [Coniella lustricola]
MTVLPSRNSASVLVVILALQLLFAHGQSFDPNKAGPQIWDPDQVGTNTTTNATYNNPIFTQNVGDPWITKYTDASGQLWYLFTYTTNDNITLKRSKALTDNWDYAETRVVFNPNSTSGEPWSTDLWAPEIHNISGSFYIIFTATPDFDNPPPLQDALCPINCPAINHRMFVLEGGSDPWQSNFTLKGMLNTYDQFAIDGTYFLYNGQIYHIYSCWQEQTSAWPANLCITHMSDPWTVDSDLADRRMISVPNEPWERVPYGRPDVRLATNEGPQQLVNPVTGQNFVIYSAARVNTPFYCLGMLELVGNDPMEYQSWRKHRDGCVFHQNTVEGIYGTGHASFTTSPDGSEDYLIYHAQTTAEPLGDLYRTIRTQKFLWNADGTPNFPLAENGPFTVPSGQHGQVAVSDRSLLGQMEDSFGSMA